jgi:hypothetical protein
MESGSAVSAANALVHDPDSNSSASAVVFVNGMVTLSKFVVTACDKREAFAQGSEATKQSKWMFYGFASLLSQ